MTIEVSPEYVVAMLATQGYAIDRSAAAAIAPTLAAQLRQVASAYDRLAFEAEPSAFSRHLVVGAIR